MKITFRRSSNDGDINVYLDDKGITITTENDELDYNFVPDTLEVTTEEMNNICEIWRDYVNP